MRTDEQMSSLRRLLLPTIGATLMVTGLVGALLGRTDVALAAASALLGVCATLLWDLRRRAGDLAHMARLSAGRQRELASSLATSSNEFERLLRQESQSTRLEAMEQRLLRILETERVVAADRHRAALAMMTEQAETSLSAAGRAEEKIKQAIVRTGRETTQELAAVGQLLSTISPRRLLPALGNFAMNPREIAQLVDLLREHQPRTVLELGSGASTVWLGYLLEEIGGHLVSVDHDPGYGDATRAMISEHGLESVVDVRLAALTDVAVDDETFSWYDRSAFADVTEIDLLLVDGPPKSTGPSARYPALPLLLAQLAPDGLVVLDDANRPDEAATVSRWLANHPVQRESVAGGRLAIMRRVPNT